MPTTVTRPDLAPGPAARDVAAQTATQTAAQTAAEAVARTLAATARRLADAEAEFDAALDARRPMPVLVRLDQEVAIATRRHRRALACLPLPASA